MKNLIYFSLAMSYNSYIPLLASNVGGIRYYSNENKNLYKYKFDLNNVIKVSKYIKEKEGEFDGIVNSEFISLIDNKINNNYIPGYKLVDSIYDIESIDIGLIEDVNTFNQLELDFFNKYRSNFITILNDLVEGNIYKLIFRWQIISNEFGETNVQFNTSHALFVNKHSDVDVLLYKFYNNLVLFENKYGFSGKINLDIFVKEWINDKDFKLFQLVLDKIKAKELEFKKSIEKNKNNKLNQSHSFGSYFGSDFDKIRKFSIASNIIGCRYGDMVSSEYIDKFNIRDKININLNEELYSNCVRNNKYLVRVNKLNENENSVIVYLEKSLLSNNDNNIIEIERWIDKLSHDDKQLIVNRVCEINGVELQFVEDDIERINIKYNGKVLLESYYNYEYDDSIGAIDIETYNNSDNIAIPYSIGYKTSKENNFYYLDNYSSSDEMILDCISDMLCKENHNFKFYAHNMSEFDGILILKSLMNIEDKHTYVYKVYSDNDGKIISIDITKKLNNRKVVKISILDSYLLLPFNLRKLGKVFDSEEDKGIFPYSFVNESNIGYVGTVPSIKYFSDVSIKEYEEYSINYKKDWSCKFETLIYLSKDLDVLYEVVSKFSKQIFKDFKINITRIRTISGLAFLIYTSKYYKPKEKPIYFTSGKLEKYVRAGYYGGIVDLLTNYTDYDTYKYDVNSHYPNAMLNNMPGGKPIISNEKNLDNIFGFVEAEVIAPSKEELKVPILPIKIEGKTVLFRGSYRGIWFSEELKMARDYGYKVDRIYSCVKFEKVAGLFDDYIKDIYDKKRNADINKNEIERLINKLLLNSLYGRLGIKSKNINLKIVKNEGIDKLLKIEDSDVLYQTKNSSLVKSRGPLDPEILRIINNEKLYSKSLDTSDLNSRNPWKGISSSVHISAAITAYGRMYLNKFKNIKDNEYLGGDTDSIILTKPLDSIYIGDLIGKFKLEYIITEGFYLSKKFYLLVTKENKIIIRSKGINNNKNEIDYNTFVSLFKGHSINIKQIQFIKNLNTLEVGINLINKTIPGLQDNSIKYKLSNRAIAII